MIKNKNIVITGANSGIGYETLKLLARENNVLAVDKDISNLENFPEKVKAFKMDVGTKEGVDSVFSEAEKLFGTIDIFYANAGFPYYEPYDYCDWDRIKNIFDTNVFSPFYSLSKYKVHLDGKKGVFAITISAIGQMAMPGYALYSASKFAVEGFQQAVRLELDKNIQLTCLYPVATDTNFFKTANPVEFEKPFPVQKPAHVAKAMVKGIEKGKKSVFPSKLFLLSKILMTVCPPIKTVYRSMENKKLTRFKEKLKAEKKSEV